MVDYLGIELIIAFVIILPFLILSAAFLRRALTHGHVWYQIGDGLRIHKGHGKPDDKGDLHDLDGTYHTYSGGTVAPFELVVPGWGLPEAPLFRYRKGNPWPLAPRAKQVFKLVDAKKPVDPKSPEAAAANGGGSVITKRVPQLVGYEVYYEPQPLPAETVEVFMGQKVFADAYAGHGKLLLLIVILIVVVLLVSIAGLVKR